MISLKRVLAADAVPLFVVLTRFLTDHWWSGFYYDMYRPIILQVKLLPLVLPNFDSDFYVVNSQYQVYKCIYNGTSPSDPNGKPSSYYWHFHSIITTGDSYRWKYMYTIPLLPSLSSSVMNTCQSLPTMR